MKIAEIIAVVVAYIAFLLFVILFCFHFGPWWVLLMMLFIPRFRYTSDREEGSEAE